MAKKVNNENKNINQKELNSRVKGLKVGVVLVLIGIITVGYAFLSSNLNINGTGTIPGTSWDIHFENLNVTNGSITAITPAKIEDNKTQINFETSLTSPGDFYEFTVDIANRGTLDAKITDIIEEGVPYPTSNYIIYTAEYVDGTEIARGDVLRAGYTKPIKVRIEFSKNVSGDELEQDEKDLDLSFELVYEMAD